MEISIKGRILLLAKQADERRRWELNRVYGEESHKFQFVAHHDDEPLQASIAASKGLIKVAMLVSEMPDTNPLERSDLSQPLARELFDVQLFFLMGAFSLGVIEACSSYKTHEPCQTREVSALISSVLPELHDRSAATLRTMLLTCGYRAPIAEALADLAMALLP